MAHFECAFDELLFRVSLAGVVTVHNRIWEYHVQELIRHDALKKLGRSKWFVRLGFDQHGLGGVAVTQEIDRGRHYDLVLAAIACRLRRQHDGRLGDEMLEDTLSVITDRCAAYNFTGDVLVTGIVHRDNNASKRMCERNKFAFVPAATLPGAEDDESDDDYEDWQRLVPIPDLELLFTP